MAFFGSRTYHRGVIAIEDAGFEIRDQIMWLYGSGFPKSHNIGDGWGTALKPAHEPVVVARKPIEEKNIAANVLKYGTGAINIDESRVDGGSRPLREVAPLRDDVKYNSNSLAGRVDGSLQSSKAVGETTLGRWPANVIHDGAIDIEEGRFFYCAKASKSDRDEGNNHPTVKPTDLMKYLVKLVTQKDGIVLDPFMGSGTTGVACKNLNRNFIGIEKDDNYFKIASDRINNTQA